MPLYDIIFLLSVNRLGRGGGRGFFKIAEIKFNANFNIKNVVIVGIIDAVILNFTLLTLINLLLGYGYYARF